MDYETAVEELTFHCGSHPNIEDTRWAAGFLQSLRPYRGTLDRDAWEHVLECVHVVAEHLKTAPAIDRAVINSLWGICHYARAWALHPDGMLPRNNLISPDDQRTLAEWLDELSERISFMLDGGHDPKHDA